MECYGELYKLMPPNTGYSEKDNLLTISDYLILTSILTIMFSLGNGIGVFDIK